MVNPSEIGGFVSQYGQNLLPIIMRWVGIVLISALILGGLYLIYLFFTFNISVHNLFIGERRGANGMVKYYIKKVKTQRARRAKDKGIPKFFYLWSRQKSDPVPERYIVPSSGILTKETTWVYNVDGEVRIPSVIDFSVNSPVTINFTPLPYMVRRAMSLEMQEVARDYQDQGFMAKYGNIFVTLLTVVFCLILAGAVIWMTYKYIGGELGQAAAAAKDMGEAFREGLVQRFGN